VNPEVLVAGVGNVFLGDDGFGVEVARRLARREFPPWVRVADYGVRGMHLAYDLAGGEPELTILVDAAARGDPPGTVTVIELGPDTAAASVPELFDAHGMQPDVVLNLVGLLGGRLRRVLLVGCEPAALEHRIGLSPAVSRAVEAAAGAVSDLVAGYRPRSLAWLAEGG
jgi:hydrogenase maturation protease